MKIFRATIFLGFLMLAPISYCFASANFNLILPNKEIRVGDSFSITVSANSPSQAMNAASGMLQVSGGASITGVNKNSSVVDFWTIEPRLLGNQIQFEGVVLNPGFQGQTGKLFNVNFLARKEGSVVLNFSDGAILANDGLGSNIIDSLASRTIKILPPTVRIEGAPDNRPIATLPTNTKIQALPVITDYSGFVDSDGRAYIKGKGEPNALTKLSFKDVSLKSLGEQFVSALQTKKKKPTEALVKNDAQGFFQYTSTDNLIAGVYNVTPFLVDEDTQTQKPGFGIQFLVSNSKLVRWLVVLINILILLIPVVCLGVIIYFIPWYSRLRMKILGHKIKLEDEKLNLTEKQLKQQEELIGKA